ncbi:MAG: tetratricopeptide repeat protein [Candidatus Omnitrophota bacterium]|nr:tetratricopeptide repeat protein [Candidatus Omnitrophota bacterium]
MRGKFFIISLTVIILSGLLAYANSFSNGFIWDDEVLILGNGLIKNISNFNKIITQELMDKTATNYYRPLQVFSFMLDYHFWKLNPFGYHLHNFLLHILNAILIYVLVSSIMYQVSSKAFVDKQSAIRNPQSAIIPLFTALLWVVHPAHTESVSYISGRADLLSGFFLLSAMILYLSNQKPVIPFRAQARNQKTETFGVFYLLSIFCFILALFSKEMSIIFPLALICYEYFFRENEKLSSRVKRILPFLIIVIFYIFLRLTILNFAAIPIWKKASLYSPNNIIRFFSFLKGAALYLGLTVMPVNLHMERFIVPAKAIFDIDVLVFMLIFVVFLFIVRRLRQEKKRFVIFGAIWFLIFLFPQSTFVFVALMAEHYLYLPSIGIFLAISCGFEGLYNNPAVKKSIVSLVIAAIVIFFGLLTFSQNYVWHDALSFYRWTDKYAQSSYLTRNNLANIYAFLGNEDLAIAKYEQALAINPSVGIIRENIGKIEDNLIEKYKNAVKSKPGFAVNYYNLACLYRKKGRFDEALLYYKKAIELRPNFIEAITNSGNVYEARGDYEEALNYYKKAVLVQPRFAQAYFNIGVVLANQNKLKEAEGYFEKALMVDPDYEKARAYISQIQQLLVDVGK